MNKLSIGIDCGEKTGIGIFDRETGRLVCLHTTDFFGVAGFLETFKSSDELKIFVEVPAKFIYARNSRQSGAVRDKHAINIGGNIREAELMAKHLRREGFDVTEVAPVRQTKWTAEQFQRIMNSDLKTNQHERDAARIAYFYAGKK
jgi:hypothetical protein